METFIVALILSFVVGFAIMLFELHKHHLTIASLKTDILDAKIAIENLTKKLIDDVKKNV